MHFSTPTEMEERLKKEGVNITNDQIVEFQKIFWDPNMELEIK
jgi:methylated-DNA-protein-cysteine methyltransferase-like protein